MSDPQHVPDVDPKEPADAAPSFFAEVEHLEAVHNPHDTLFQAVLSTPESGREALTLLPSELHEQLDTSQYQHTNSHFISDKLRNLYSDALIKVGLKSKTPVFLYFLVEHLSKVDRWMPLRFGEYLFAAWRHLLNLSKKPPKRLPMIIPILFYNGQKKYGGPLELSKLLDVPAGMDDYVMRQKIILINLCEISDDRLKEAAYLGPVFLALKHAFDAQMPTEEIVLSLKNVPQSHQRRFREMVSWYIINVRKEVDVHDLIQSMNKHIGECGGDTMTYAQQLRKEGKAEGKAEGRAEGIAEGETKGKLIVAVELFKKGIPFEDVLAVTGLSRDMLITLDVKPS